MDAKQEAKEVNWAAKVKKLEQYAALQKRVLKQKEELLGEKDKTIEELSADLDAAVAKSNNSRPDFHQFPPKRIIFRIRDGDGAWCLVQFEDESLDEEWLWFDFEVDVDDYVRRAEGEPLLLPPYFLDPEEAAKVQEDARSEVQAVKEEFRKYRVRAEIVRKQKDAKIRETSQTTIAQQQQRIAGQDMEGELASARAQIARLCSLQTELDRQESVWRDKLDTLRKENAELKRGGEAAIAAQWRERYEGALRDKDAALGRVLAGLQRALLSTGDEEVDSVGKKEDEGAAGEVSVGACTAAAEVLGDRYKKLIQECQMYKQKTQAKRNGAGAAQGAENDMRYLKNIVLQYMASSDTTTKEHMERAIFTVLRFSPSEIRRINEKRAAESSWGLW